MTPIDRKIDIMNKTYISTVQRLTDEIIELKTNEDPQIDLDNITIPTDFQLEVRAKMADSKARKAELDISLYRIVCVLQLILTLPGMHLKNASE